MQHQGMRSLISVMYLKIMEAYKAGCRVFISGMAEGIDLHCARLVSEFIVRDEMPEAKLVCALPYKEQIRELKDNQSKYTYSLLLRQSAQIVIVSEQSCRDRYKLRNRFMVDHSSRVIGAFKSKPGGSGTLQTINMAKNAGIYLDIVDLNNPKIFPV